MKTITIKTFKAQGGFSLAELLVACAMVGIVLAGTFVALQSGESAFQYSTGKVEVQQNARVALDRMIRDLRTGSSVTAATPTSISFIYTDENNAAVTVTYSVTGTTLQRNQANPVPAAAQPETVIGGVNTFALVYYDSNNAVTTTVANIRVVDVRLITQSETTGLASYNMANQQATFEDRVRMRNL
jgi:prepilin-type N-terminal cleavage/methylation domain-containing protein